MKRAIRNILCMAAFAVPAVSCQKEVEEFVPVAGARETIEISIKGLMGEYTQVDATKSSLVNSFRVSWAEGDVVYVYDGTQYLGSLVASLDENGDDRYALLSTDGTHTVTAPAAGSNLTLVLSPLLEEAPAVTDGTISISLAGQSGQKAPFVAYATLDYNNEGVITNALVPFEFATSVVRVNCAGLKAFTAVENATLSNVNTVCRLTLSATAAPAVTGDENGTIIRTGDTYFAAEKVNIDGEAVFQIALPVLESTSARRVLSVTQGKDVFMDTEFTKKSLAAATSVNTVCQFVKPDAPAGFIPAKFSVSADRQVYFSSGNLYWDGRAFKFEANQYDTILSEWTPSHVCHFFWTTEAEEAVKAKYNTDLEENITDVFFTNATEETAKPGLTINGITGKCRTLSSAEWRYLIEGRTVNGGKGVDKSYSYNVFYGGVMGVVLYPDDYTGDLISGTVTALPEGVVFLPASSYRTENTVHYSEDSFRGRYWSSSLLHDGYENDNIWGDCGLAFDDTRVNADWNPSRRFLGCAVRVVSDCSDVVLPDGICINLADGETMLISEMNYGAGSPVETGTALSWETLQAMELQDGWTLPTYDDLKTLSSLPHYETEFGTVWRIDGRTLFIPYTKDLNEYKESRLWISGEESPSYFYFTSKGTSGKVLASKVADQRFYVRPVMNFN